MNDLPNFPLEDFITREELIQKYQITLDSNVDIVDINILNKIKNECFLPKLKAMFKCRKDDNEFQDNQKIDFVERRPCIHHIAENTICILLSSNAKINYNVALFELAHETLHTLFVNKKEKYGSYLEEGLATLFQFAIKKHFQLNYFSEDDLENRYKLALYLVCDLIKESKIFTEENNIIKSIQKIVRFKECNASHILQIIPEFNKIKAEALCSDCDNQPHENLEQLYSISISISLNKEQLDKIKQQALSKINFSNDEVDINLDDIQDISSTPK